MGILSYGEGNKLFAFVNRLVDLLWLNLLWIAFSLPLVTIGASTVAAYSVALKLVDEEEGRIARSFLKAFRRDFGRATILWLIQAACLYALWLDWQLSTKVSDPPLLVMVAGIATAGLVLLCFAYAYPIIARYESGVPRALLNSARICFRYFGRSGFLVLVLAIEILLFSWNAAMIVVGCLVGPMILIYTIAGVARRIFKDIEADNAALGDTGKGR